MKNLPFRETVWLILPILFIGGVAAWKNRGGVLPAVNPFDSGPLRVEISEAKQVELSPLNVQQGFDWASKVDVALKGSIALPQNWKMVARTLGPSGQAKLFYRRGKTWKSVSPDFLPRWAFSYDKDEADNSITFKVNLDALPSDVEEVELRGQVQNTDWYTGAIPGGWKPPANMKISGVNRYLDVVSRSFKVVVWKWGTPRPKPEVSRKTKIELRGVRWFTVPYSNGPKEYVYLNLRNVSQNNWVERGLLIVQNVHFFDSSGHEIPLFDKRNVGARVTNFGLTIVNQAQFSPQKPTTDRIVVLVPWDVAPQKGWRHYPSPLRLECEVSDGQCWPTKISTPLKHDIQTDEKMLAFGAPGSH